LSDQAPSARYLIENGDWQHYLTRPYSLFGASLWQQSYVSDQALEVFGMKLTHGLYVEDQPGIVRQYRHPEDAKAFKARFKNLALDKPNTLASLLQEAKDLNAKAEELLQLPQPFDNLSEAVAFLDRLFTRATILPNWSLEAMHHYKIGSPQLAKLCKELRSVSIYPQFIQQVLVPLAIKALETRKLKHAQEVVHYLTLQEIHSASQRTINERLQCKSKDLRYCLLVENTHETVTWLINTKELINTLEPTENAEMDSIKGDVAYKGKVSGTARLVLKAEDLTKHVSKTDILVMVSSNPQFIRLMKACGGMVVDEGGITSHASILARELKKPCIIATNHGTRLLNEGDTVEVDAFKGIVTVLERA
jgi:phosphoenolpyruvate synthase/pyruvate phosphate dikinase